MFGSLGPTEIMVIAVLLLLIFGPRQLPRLAKSIGETVREGRKAARELQSELDDTATTVNRETDKIRHG